MKATLKIASTIVSAAMIAAPANGTATLKTIDPVPTAQVVYETETPEIPLSAESVNMADITAEAGTIAADDLMTSETASIEEPCYDGGVTTKKVYFVKPGDQKAYADRVLTFSHFQEVTEVKDGRYVTLTGWTPSNGDWSYSFSIEEVQYGSTGTVPFSVEMDGTAIGMPIACYSEGLCQDGFTFTGTVSISPAPNCTYIMGSDWNAMILNSETYPEWKHSGGNGLFPDYGKYHLAAYGGDHWVIATSDAPEITYGGEEQTFSDIDDVVAALKAFAQPFCGISDPHYGGIEWAAKAVEDWEDNAAILSGKLNGTPFTIEIDNIDPLGFSGECDWSGVFVPSDFVTRQNDSILHWCNYAINIDAESNVCVVNTQTGESRSFQLEGPANANTSVFLITVTDGKHGNAFTARPELVEFVYALDMMN
jgi:hypothetical protein